MKMDSRCLRYASFITAVIVAIAAALAFHPTAQNAQRKKNESVAGSTLSPKLSSNVVNLPGGAFDPVASEREGKVPGGAELSASGDEGYYIVQFDKTADDEMLDNLRATGVEILQYVPNRAFYVYAPGVSAQSSAATTNVRWMGRLRPEHKIPTVLAVQLNAAKTKNSLPNGIARLEMASTRTAIFDVAVFKRADLKAAADRVAASTGGKVRNVIELPGNFFNIVRLEAPIESATLAAQVEDVFRIDAWSRPSAEDERAAQIVAGNYTSTTVIDAPGYNPLAQFGVDGTGVTISVVDDGVGIPGDGGFYLTSANVVNGPLRGATSGADGHGHLNASIIAGTVPFSSLDSSGYNYGLGVAPNSHIINIPLLRDGYSGTEASTVDDTVATAGPNGVPGFISNNSWGNGENGNTYDTYTAQYDGFVRDASSAASIDPLLIVFSAGNSGGLGLTRPKMSKNTIAVANLENIRTELSASANNMDDLNGTSSIGPAADGRIKPDIAAPGTAITGGRSGTDILFGNIGAYHRWSSGTSHAAPHVAGAAALFTQYWKANHTGVNPSPALVKAALINGARDVNGVSTSAATPNGFEGWGRVNLKNVLNTGAIVTYVNETDELAGTGAARIYTGSVADPGRPLRITLVWTDPPGAADPALVNDLDLEVTVGGITFRGNVLSGGQSVAGGPADAVNNVENVFLPAGQTGPLSVRVRAKAINGDGILGNADPTDQHFALVVHNGGVALDTSAFIAAETPVLLSGNSILEPNECNSINIPVTNVGQTTATGVSATLTTSAPGVSVLIGNASYPDIAPGATALNQTSFQIFTDGTVACLTNIDLRLTISFSGGDSPFVHDFTMRVGQPGGTNYTFASSSGATISAGGSLVAGSQADDAIVNFTAPFAFSVYGTSVPAGSNLRLSTNGFLRIESAGSSSSAAGNATLPSNGGGSFPANLPVVMPYWDDLDMSSTVTSGGGIYTDVKGPNGSRTLKIEWRARRWVAGQALGAVDTKFAVYFHESSNNFEYVYGLTGTGPSTSGASATVGVQAASTGTVFTQFSSGTASLSSGQMISATIGQAVCSAGAGFCVVTSAPATVAGQVLTRDGRGVGNATVTLTDMDGGTKRVMTNSFGFFRFDDVPSGISYIVSVSASGYSFASQLVVVNDDVTDLTFVPVRW